MLRIKDAEGREFRCTGKILIDHASIVSESNYFRLSESSFPLTVGGGVSRDLRLSWPSTWVFTDEQIADGEAACSKS